MSENKRASGSGWVDPDDAPEWTEEMFDRAEIRAGNKLVRPATGTLAKAGRPPQGERAKRQVTLRLDPEIIERFRASGPGWQSRINELLRKAAGL
jgi:uncharacterized protein (DUF4415 family)